MRGVALPGETRSSISREEVGALPIRRYEGEVRLVATPQALERSLVELGDERVVGFDTETRPAFKPGESYLPCLAQIATARAVHVFQLQRVDCSAALARILGAAGIVKAGVGLAYDLERLKLLFPITEASVLDLGAAARRSGVAQTGVRNLAGIFLGFRIPKGKRTSNWAAARLSPAQLTYAATDAWACRELYLCFERLGLLGK